MLFSGFQLVKTKKLKPINQGRYIKYYQVPLKHHVTIKNKYKNVYGGYDDVAKIMNVNLPSKMVLKAKQEVTILLVGVTGAGKSTLVDAFINCVLNVRYEDMHRFKLIHLDSNEKDKEKNQALSQTDNIVVYKIPCLQNRIPFQLNIIDTPGVGDTRGKKKDDALLDKLQALFSDPKNSISCLNAICFVSHAGKARLTPEQNYIFDKIITNVGKDMKNNFIGLFTNDDGNPPKALHAFNQAGIGLSAHFEFSSLSVIEDKKTSDDNVHKSILLTNEPVKDFQSFYDNFDKLMGTVMNLSPVSTQDTAKVMKTRKDIDARLYALQLDLRRLLGEKETLRQEKQLYEKFLSDEKAYQDYTAEVTTEYIEHEKLPEGTYVTNCRRCNRTCHENCGISNDDEKYHCLAMDNQGK